MKLAVSPFLVGFAAGFLAVWAYHKVRPSVGS